MIKQRLKNLAHKINNHKVKYIAGIGLAGLVAITSLKDNVHFGAVNLNNPQENHYAWGLWPTIGISGKDIKGNFYSLGLLAGSNNLDANSTITGDMKAYGLLFGANNFDDSTITGDMKAYGLLVGWNIAEGNCKITGNIVSKGLIAETPKGKKVGSNVEIGLKDYTVNTGKVNLK